MTRRRGSTDRRTTRFLARLREALGRFADGVHLLGAPASAPALAAAAARLGPLPASLLEVYRFADGLELFGDVARVAPLAALERAGEGALALGEADGRRLLAAPDGAILDEDDDGDRLVVAPSLEDALLVYLAREALLLDEEGEWREAFGEDGEVAPAVRRRRVEAARRRAPDASRWLVEAAELALELDGDEPAAEALLAEARALDPSAAAAHELYGLLLGARGAGAEAARALALAAEHSGAARRADRAVAAADAAAAIGDDAARVRWAEVARVAEPGIAARLASDAELAIAAGRLEDADRLARLVAAVAGEAALSPRLRARARLRLAGDTSR